MDNKKETAWCETLSDLPRHYDLRHLFNAGYEARDAELEELKLICLSQRKIVMDRDLLEVNLGLRDIQNKKLEAEIAKRDELIREGYGYIETRSDNLRIQPYVDNTKLVLKLDHWLDKAKLLLGGE